MPQASARHILVPTEESCTDLKQQIEGGTDFAVVAKEHSKCPSGARGGDLGSFGPGQMVPEFDQAVFNGNVGELQGPIQRLYTSAGITPQKLTLLVTTLLRGHAVLDALRPCHCTSVGQRWPARVVRPPSRVFAEV